MLYLAVDASRPERVQGVFISDREIEELVHFWQTTPRGPLPKVSLHTVGDGDAAGAGGELDADRGADRDQLLDKAIELAYKHSKMSTSLLQRRLRIGYPRAARLMDQLEDEGIIGPSDGSKSRDVIITGA
jgi:S-DNA-T family DNA segregation ATPase FtsK/SpoIIIE